MEQGDLTKAHCNTCSGERNHLLIHHHQKKWHYRFVDHPSAVSHGQDDYELLKCAGCDRITLRHTSTSSDETDEEGNVVPTICYYPAATSRKLPKWLSGWEGLSIHWSFEFIPQLLREIYTALHGDCRNIAAMGVRALLERVMIDRVGDHASFRENLRVFQEDGFIGRRQKEVLETTLDFGHASTHRSYTPTRDDIRRALDITENVIESVYVSQEQAAALKKSVPRRK